MKKHQDIDAVDLFNLLKNKDIELIDVRNADEVARGIIPSAKYITLSSIPTLDLSQFENKTVVFYCHAGIRSAQAAAFVASQIDASIYNLRGGILAWGSAGFDFTSL
jgi:rhodanese-related sulfurtransferase